jgi:hypothetical protein
MCCTAHKQQANGSIVKFDCVTSVAFVAVESTLSFMACLSAKRRPLMDGACCLEGG